MNLRRRAQVNTAANDHAFACKRTIVAEWQFGGCGGIRRQTIFRPRRDGGPALRASRMRRLKPCPGSSIPRRKRLRDPQWIRSRLNKIIGAILGTLLFVMGVGFLAEAIYTRSRARPGLCAARRQPRCAGRHHDDAGRSRRLDRHAARQRPIRSQGRRLRRSARPATTFTTGGPNKTGPNLYDVVERGIGSHEGFAYSAVLPGTRQPATPGPTSNLEPLHAPRPRLAPGTKMTFAGVKDDAGARQHHRLSVDAVGLAQAVPATRCSGDARRVSAAPAASMPRHRAASASSEQRSVRPGIVLRRAIAGRVRPHIPSRAAGCGSLVWRLP